MSGDHDPGHAGHSHGVSENTDSKRLSIALALIVGFMAVEVVVGILAHSLALLSEILSAQANGATLLVLAGLIIYEGISRLITPPPAGGTAILVVALLGIAVNVAATWQLSKANRDSMNIEGSFQHILTDLAAFIFTAIAGLILITTGWVRQTESPR